MLKDYLFIFQKLAFLGKKIIEFVIKKNFVVKIWTKKAGTTTYILY